MNENYCYMEAVRAWQNANRNLKHFAECCYYVADRQTLALAQDCKCSVDTIENYRNSYALYMSLGGSDSEPVRECWEEANAALWVKAAQLRSRLELPLDKTWEYLQTATVENMTRESFAAHVDERENDTPKWIRRLRSAIRFLTPSKDDYKSGMPPELQERYDRAVAAFVAELEEIAEVRA
jgi:hypothetical protein